MTGIYDADRLARLAADIDVWLRELADAHEHITAVESMGPDDTEGGVRWIVRMRGEEKDVSAVWFTVGQRTLRFESYVMPAPEENIAAVFENVLRRNDRLVGAHFSIGAEDAIFLRGEVRNDLVSADELDRILGTVYAAVERCFRPLIRLGFASKFGDR